MRAAGIDAGGSGSRILVLEGGEAVYSQAAGPANWSTSGRETAINAIVGLLQGAGPIDQLAICIAGAVSEASQDEIRTLAPLLKEVSVYPDYFASLRACDDPHAICVISGTGSGISSLAEDGVRSTGGGGAMIGDFGSGLGVGRLALQTWLYQLDSDWTSITELCEQYFATTNYSQVVHAIYSSASPPAAIANFGTRIAQSDRPAACKIVQEQMQLLAKQAKIHADQHHPNQPMKIFRSGGFWNASPRVVQSFEAAAGPSFELPYEPVWGAAKLAEEGGIR